MKLTGSTQVTTYVVATPINVTRLSDYPLDWLSDDHWQARLWDDESTDGEVRALDGWLKEHETCGRGGTSIPASYGE